MLFFWLISKFIRAKEIKFSDKVECLPIPNVILFTIRKFYASLSLFSFSILTLSPSIIRSLELLSRDFIISHWTYGANVKYLKNNIYLIFY